MKRFRVLYVAGRNGLLLGGLALLTWGAQLNAQQPTGRISGVVRDASTQGPVEGATVRVGGESAQLTDAGGRYFFQNVRVGTVLLEIRRIGYQVLFEPDVLVRSDRTTVLAHALRVAAADLRIGETVMLALIVLGDAGVAGAGALAIETVVAALHTVGLRVEARALALEAALAAGI